MGALAVVSGNRNPKYKSHQYTMPGVPVAKNDHQVSSRDIIISDIDLLNRYMMCSRSGRKANLWKVFSTTGQPASLLQRLEEI